MHTKGIAPLWLLAALLGHSAWGIYPVLARYLQIEAGLPGLTLLTVANGFAMIVMCVVVGLRGEFRQLLIRAGWMVAVFAALRAITNVLAARYAPAAQVTLIGLLTPPLVAIMGKFWFDDPPPAKTALVLGISMTGAIIMLSSEMQAESFWQGGSTSSWVGVALAVTSSVMLALYMLSVRRTHKHNISSEATFLLQLIAVVASSIPLSVGANEDWSRWQQLTSYQWTIFLIFALGIVIGANLLQVYTLRKLGAPLVTSVQAWRLPVAAIAGGIVMNEWLSTPAEYIGALITAGSVTWYLIAQRSQQPAKSRV
ncbi:MAG: DMT family transporter [Chloroflexi bacterium]|nr:DMT family transporter [Chloroflexota bacterium]